MAKELTYEQVNQRIDKLSVSIQKVVAAYKKLEAQGKTSSEINKILAKDIERVTNQLNSTSNATLRYGKQLSTTDAQRKSANKSLEAAFASHEKLTGAINKTRIAQEKASNSNKTFGDGIRSAFSPQSIGSAIGNVAKFLGIYQVLGTVVSTVTGFFTQSIQKFIEFDKNVSRVSAITGATGKELNTLKNEIRTIAVETRFTADEVANLSVELGKLGISSTDIPRLLNPISIAAQATGEELTSVGVAIVKVSNQFNLSSAEAATTSAILTQAVNKSALTLESFGTAIGYVGPLAAQSGLEFDKTAKILGILSDNGFSASRAGTGLRKILIDLKKPGVDITQTLNELADANISVQKAEELVGKTSAAQLVTILQNIDAVNDVTVAQEGFAEQLRASSIQMSSLSGQLDILNSAYSELQISVGEYLIQNEFVLSLIGILSDKSEELARGFILVKNESERLGDAFNKRLAEGLKNGNTELEILNSLLRDTDDKNVKEVIDAINEADPKTLRELNEELDKIEKGPAWARNTVAVLSVFSPTIASAAQGLFDFFRTSDEAAKSVKGLTGSITELTNEEKNSRNIAAGVRAVNREYKDQFDAIVAIKDASIQRNRAQTLSQELLKRANIAEKESNKLLQSGNAEERAKGNLLAGRAKQYKVFVSGLSEYTNELESNTKSNQDATDKYLSLFEQRKKALDIELKKIKDGIEEETKAYNSREKSINEYYELKIRAAATDEEKANLAIKKQEELAVASELYETALYNYNSSLTEWNESIGDFYQEYALLFKDSEKNTLRNQNANEQLNQSLTDLAQTLTKLNQDAAMSGGDLATSLIGDAGVLVSAFSDGLKSLDDAYSDTAYGQYQLYLAQKQYLDGLDESRNKLIAYYDSVKDQLSPEERAKLEAAIDIVSKMFNDAADGIISDEDAQKYKNKFLELGAGFGESWNLGIDLTLGEGLNMILNNALDSISKFNDVALENTKNRLEKEKDALQNQYDIEDEILQAKLESQLISEAEYRAQVEKNRKKEAQAINKIDKQIFDAEQKRDRQSALSDYLTSLGSIIPNLIVTGKVGDPVTLSLKYALSAALASFSYGNELRAINQRQFFPTKFADGGLVNGPSHSEGGVPFSVRGQGGYEMEGGEYIVNKKSTQKYRSLLDQINGYGKSNYKFAAGGIVKDPIEVANRQIELLEAIASSNISMVGKLDKPVRAFVSAADLRSDENARRIQERNSQL
jgi:hypothetical protein